MKKIVVLVSGGGTNLQALIDAQRRGEIKNGEITCVIASKQGAYALTRAEKAGIKTRVIERKQYPDSKTFSAIFWRRSRRKKPILWSMRAL